MNKESKIYVAGHRGMVGSAIVRELTRQRRWFRLWAIRAAELLVEGV